MREARLEPELKASLYGKTQLGSKIVLTLAALALLPFKTTIVIVQGQSGAHDPVRELTNRTREG